METTNTSISALDVVAVNHGKQFGHENWYTFHCPACSKVIEAGAERCNCGKLLSWPALPATNKEATK